MNKKAFTLVELIVVITILAILWTIAFLSFQWYSRDARDSVRKSDISLIVTSLDLHETQVGEYPDPTNGIDITFSGGQIRNQWTIGDSVIRVLNKINEKPIDPLTSNEYTYSRLNTKKQYEVATVLEWWLSYDAWIIDTAHAADGTELGTTYIRGNYNGMVAKVNTWSVLYTLAVPTIISGDIELTDILTLQAANKLVYHGSSNLPDSYKDTVYNRFGWGFIFNPTDIVVYTGSTQSLKTESNQVAFLNNLKTVYSATQPSITHGTLKKLVATTIDTNSPSDEVKLMASSIVKNNLNSQVKTYDVNSSWWWETPRTDYPTLILSHNPIAYYRFEETSWTTMIDSSWNGNNGSLQSVWLWNTSLIYGTGGSGYYSGWNTVRSTFPYTTFNVPFTFEARVKLAGHTWTNNWKVLVAYWAHNIWIGEAFWLWWPLNSESMYTYWFIDASANQYVLWPTTGFYVPNQVNHIVVTIWADRKITTYVNGVKKLESSMASQYYDDPYRAMNYAAIGWTTGETYSSWQYSAPLWGYVDEVAVYQTDLTQAQILEHYNAWKPE